MNREAAGPTEGGRHPRGSKSFNEATLRIATERLVTQFHPKRVILDHRRGELQTHVVMSICWSSAPWIPAWEVGEP
jgi:hypothetical protein